jgi:hypothetical protein
MKILNLVIILQLVLLSTPVSGPMTSSVAYANDDCQEGMYFHPQLRRCVLNKEVQDMKYEIKNECAGKTGAALRACHEEIANKAADLEGKTAEDYEEEVKDGNLARYGLPIVISVIAAYYLLKVKKDNPQCKTGSMWLMIGGAAAALITEITAQKKFREKVETLQNEYESNMASIDNSPTIDEDSDKNQARIDQAEAMTQGQVMSIDYMIAMEEERKAVANKRKKGYLIAALAYTAAVGLAIYEQTQAGSMSFGSCSKSDTTPQPAPTQTYYTPINPKDNDQFSMDKIVLMSPEMQELTQDYAYLGKIEKEEFYEIVMRKLSDLILPSAYAEDTVVEVIEGVGTVYQSEDGSKYVIGEDGSRSQWLDGVTVTADRLPPETDNDNPAPSPDNSQIENPGQSPIVQTALKGAPQIASKQGNMIDRALRTPYIRAALAGVLAAHAWTLHKQAKDNEEESQRRINALNEIRLDFTSTGGAGLASYCTEKDRKLPSKPNCYCFNPDGTPNKMRAGRDVCILFTADHYYKKGEYSRLGGIGYNPMKGCLSSSGKINDCSYCKKNPKSCELIPAATISGFSIGGVKPYGSALKSLNDYNGGFLNASNFDEAGIERKLRAFKKANNKLSKDPKNKEFMDKVNKLKGQINKTYSQALNRMPAKTLAAITGTAQGASSSNNFQKSLDAKLSSKVKDKLKKSDVKFTAGGDDSKGSSKSNQDGDYDFGFGDDAGGMGGVQIDDEVADVMDKNFQFDNNDIHKNKSGNIFKILSIRYQRSALIRLFDDKGEYQLDEANKTDINKQ